MKKADMCDLCRHFEYRPTGEPIIPCDRGHKPRFFKYKDVPKYFKGSGRYMRRCEDFNNSGRVA